MGGYQPVLSPGSPLRAAKECGCIPGTDLDLRERRGPAWGHLISGKEGEDKIPMANPSGRCGHAVTAAGAASLLPPHRDQAGPPSAAHTSTFCGQRSRLSVFINLFTPVQHTLGRSHLYADAEKGAGIAVQATHPSPTHARELPAELGPCCCSLTAPWASSPSFPLPWSCGAAVRPWLRCLPRAGKAPRSWSSAMIS